MRLVINNQNIKFTSLNWSGSIDSPSRQVQFSYPVSLDINIPRYAISEGNGVLLYDDEGKEIFRGYVFRREITSSSNTMTVTCFDGLIYLIKSQGSYNFKATTPSKAMSVISQDTGLTVATVTDGDVLVKVDPMIGTPYLDCIHTIYQRVAEKTGKKYIPRMVQGSLHIIAKGSITSNKVYMGNRDILDSSYVSHIEDTVNQVLVVDSESGNPVQLYPGENRDKWGVLQAIYSKSKDDTDWYNKAKSLLKGLTRQGSITMLGDVNRLAGNGIKVYDTVSGLTTSLYIDSDSHSWENGLYTTSLSLNFDNVMVGDN
jgi:hypothetical protein